MQCAMQRSLECRVTSNSGGAAAARGKRAATVRATAAAPAASSSASAAMKVAKPTLFDVPVSNHGARVRHVLYHKGLEADFEIASPASVGGLASDAYKAMSPLGKMPLLVLPDSEPIFESEVIVQYILDRWADRGPSMRAATPEARARAALITRLHDLYIASVQASMYRAMEPAARAAGIAQIAAQLDLIEGIAAAGGGPFLAGDAVTTADSALLPTVVFMRRMLPDVFGWKNVFAGRPALARWWEAVQAADPAAARVVKEVDGGLDAWFAKDRFAELGIREQVATQKDFKWAY